MAGHAIDQVRGETEALGLVSFLRSILFPRHAFSWIIHANAVAGCDSVSHKVRLHACVSRTSAVRVAGHAENWENLGLVHAHRAHILSVGQVSRTRGEGEKWFAIVR